MMWDDETFDEVSQSWTNDPVQEMALVKFCNFPETCICFDDKMMKMNDH